MTTPRRLPRPVTQPAAGDDQPNRADQTVAEVLPLSALATPAEPGEAPAGDRVKSPSGDPSEAEVIASVHPTLEAAGEAFLAMVERAEKVAPIQTGTAELPPGALLEMIGGVADPPPGGAHDREAQRAAEAALERLATAAWEVIRMGAADDEPEIRIPLVEICTRLGSMEPQEHQTEEHQTD